MSVRVLVPLAAGFEEIEAATIIDVLRRAELDVVTAALASTDVVGAHGVTITADMTLDAALTDGDFDAVVLPGGMPGAAHLRDDARVRKALVDVVERGGTAAAICAAPIALEAAGVLAGRRATCYPGFGEQLTSAAERCDDRVVMDGPVVTSAGPGTALEFATALVERLVDEATADALRAGLLLAPAP